MKCLPDVGLVVVVVVIIVVLVVVVILFGVPVLFAACLNLLFIYGRSIKFKK
jgi:hypothetical protein